MPSSSPYRQNDYSAISTYRPYSLPVNDIFKAIQAKDMYWKLGAQKVKSKYEDALGLNLTLQGNKELRDNFMQQAEKEITKLSAMDLSKADVQRQGLNIFKPLFQDEGIMYDDQATRAVSKIQADISKYRTVDGGKGYADSNARVAMEGVYEFKNATDRMAGKDFLQRNKGYTPYYDSSKEFMDITKNCKGPSLTSGRPGESTDMYLHTKELSGANGERLSQCLDYGLSERAKTQMAIDGKASYLTDNRIDHPDGRNYGALRDDYLSASASSLRSLDQNVKDLDGRIAALQTAYNTSKDPKYLEMKKAAISSRDGYLGRAKNLNESIANINDSDFLKNNYEALATQIHTRKRIAGFGEAFRNDEEVDKYSADAVKLQAQNLAFQQAKTEADWRHDERMADIEHTNRMDEIRLRGTATKKGKLGALVDEDGNEILTPTSEPWREVNIAKDGYSEFAKEEQATYAASEANNREFFNKLRETHPELEKYNATTFFTPGENGLSPADGYLDAAGKLADDPNVAKWSGTSSLLTNKMNMLKAQRELNEARLAQEHGKALNLTDVAPVNLDGRVLKAKELQDIMLGRNPDYTVRNTTKMETNFSGPGSGGANSTSGTVYKEIYDKSGKLVASQLTGKNWGDIQKTLVTIDKKVQEVKTAQNELYGNSLLTIKPTVFGDKNNLDDDDVTRNRIAAGVRVTNVKDVKILKKDPTTGDAWISIASTKENPLNSESVRTGLAERGFDVDSDEGIKIINDKEALVKIKGIPDLQDKRMTENPYTMLQMNLEKISQAAMNSGTSYGRKEPGQKVLAIPFTTGKVDGQDFQIIVRKTQGGVEYEVEKKSKTDEKDAAGNITQKKGTYNTTGMTFPSTNQLLSYLNGTR